MSLFKRGSTWWIDITTPGGKRIRCSARTTSKIQAQEFHDKLRADSWRQDQLGEKPERTWDEAALKWLTETTHKATHEEDKRKVRWLQQHFSGKLLQSLDRDLVAKIGALKAQEASPATANRYLALIRAILRRAVQDWEWLDRAPRVRLYREAKRRVRWITPEQVKMLLNELPKHQVDVVLFALATGLRQSNVVNLEWSQVDLERQVAWIYADQAKGQRDIHVSLSTAAMDVLKRQLNKHTTRVFTYQGKPLGWANTRAWKQVSTVASIQNFRWHDLRHTWASWHVQRGTPLYVVQEMGAWESEGMVRRYAHLAPAHLRQHAEVLTEVLNGTITAQSGNEKGASTELTP